LEEININMVVQINGKTREVLSVNKDLDERSITSLTKVSEKIKKYLSNKKIKKTIFVKNKIINYII